MRGEEKV